MTSTHDDPEALRRRPIRIVRRVTIGAGVGAAVLSASLAGVFLVEQTASGSTAAIESGTSTGSSSDSGSASTSSGSSSSNDNWGSNAPQSSGSGSSHTSTGGS